MNKNELFEAYLNREDYLYSVESAKNDVLMKIIYFKMLLNSKQTKAFSEVEVALKECEEVVLKDMFEFVLNFLQQKNTNNN